MNEDAAAGLPLSYGAWRERLSGLCRRARRLRPHAHSTSAGTESNTISNATATSWNPFAYASGWGTRSEAIDGDEGGPPSLDVAEELIASILAELEQLLLELRLGARLADSASARVAEAQTLLYRAAFFHELQLYLAEGSRDSPPAPAASPPPLYTAARRHSGAGERQGSSHTTRRGAGAAARYTETERAPASQRAAVAQRQQHYLYCEAQDYLASARLWLAMEEELTRSAAATGEDALSRGVLCCLTACGVLSRSGVREEENPVPLSLYRMASRCFHMSRARPGSRASPQWHSGGECDEHPAGLHSAGSTCPGGPHVEALLRAFPGQPIPPHVGDRKERGRMYMASELSLPSPCALTWSHFPPMAHHRSLRLVHGLLMSLGVTLEDVFGCYEAAVNQYELAALVLLAGAPQWMWHWDSDNDEVEEELELVSGVERMGSSEEYAEHTQRYAGTAGPGRPHSPPPSQGSTERVGRRSPRPDIFSGLVGREMAEPTALFTRAMQQMRARDDCIDRATHRRVSGRDAREEPGAPTMHRLPTRPRGEPSLSPPLFSTHASEHTARAAESMAANALPSATGTAAQRRAASIAAYVEVASDTVLHDGASLPLYLRALRQAMAAATVAGDDARVLVFANAALRAIQARELILFDSLSIASTAQGGDVETERSEMGRPSHSAGCGGDSCGHPSHTSAAQPTQPRRQRVWRLPVVDGRHRWPRPVRTHAAFRLDTAAHAAAFHVSRILVMLLAAVEAIPVRTRGAAGGKPSTAAAAAAAATAASHDGVAGTEQTSAPASGLQPLRAYAESVESSLVALEVLAAEVSTVETRLFVLLADDADAVCEDLRTPHAPTLLVLALHEPRQAEDSDVPGTPTRSPATSSPPARAVRPAPFTTTAIYQQLKSTYVPDMCTRRVAGCTAQWATPLEELSSDSEEEEEAESGKHSTATPAGDVEAGEHAGVVDASAGQESAGSAEPHVAPPTSGRDGTGAMGEALRTLATSLRAVAAVVQQCCGGGGGGDDDGCTDRLAGTVSSGTDPPRSVAPGTEDKSEPYVPSTMTSDDRENLRETMGTAVAALRRVGSTDRGAAILAERLRRRVCYPVLATTPLTHRGRG